MSSKASDGPRPLAHSPKFSGWLSFLLINFQLALGRAQLGFDSASFPEPVFSYFWLGQTRGLPASMLAAIPGGLFWHLHLTSTLVRTLRNWPHCRHFTDVDAEAQRGEVTGPGSQQ